MRALSYAPASLDVRERYLSHCDRESDLMRRVLLALGYYCQPAIVVRQVNSDDVGHVCRHSLPLGDNRCLSDCVFWHNVVFHVRLLFWGALLCWYNYIIIPI